MILRIMMVMSLVLIASCVATDVAAQTTGSTAEQQGAEDEMLGGPEIQEERGSGMRFDGAQPRRAARVRPLPLQVWLRIIGETGLTEVQRGEIQALVDEFVAEQQAFQEQHGEDLRAFSRMQRAARQDGRDIDREELRRVREIAANQPTPIPTQQQIWRLLSDDQKELATEMIAERREAQQSRRTDRARDDAAPDRANATDRMMDPMAGGSPRGSESRDLRGHLVDPGLDTAGQRRVRFLRQYQRSRPAGAPPTDEERRISFDDDE